MQRMALFDLSYIDVIWNKIMYRYSPLSKHASKIRCPFFGRPVCPGGTTANLFRLPTTGSSVLSESLPAAVTEYTSECGCGATELGFWGYWHRRSYLFILFMWSLSDKFVKQSSVFTNFMFKLITQIICFYICHIQISHNQWVT